MKVSTHAVQGASSEPTIPSYPGRDKNLSIDCVQGASPESTEPTIPSVSDRDKELSIVYYNAKSIVPKFDELCASCVAYKTDILCIVETWLNEDISNEQLDIPGFTLHRKDRHHHGGGVLIYTADSLVVSLLPTSVYDQSLEFLPISVTLFNQKFCIAVFYRPPNSSYSIFDTVFHSLELIDISQYSNFIFVCDFNVDFCNDSHPLYSKITALMDLFSLSQIVSDYTHKSSSGRHSLIDLVFISNPSVPYTCSVIPPLANSDHLGDHTTLNLQSPTLPKARHCPQKIWRCSHADYSKARQLISNVDWESLLSENIDQSWHPWQHTFLTIMEECILRRALTPRRHNLPWLNKRIIQSMRRRNNLFKRIKISSDNAHKYRQARNRVVAVLRLAKREYFCKLNPCKSKEFWKSIKVINKCSSSIPVISQGSTTLSSDQQKADALNSFFSQCFKYKVPPLIPLDCNHMNTCPEDLLCTVEEVTVLLKSLNISKASGPDGISARMLKATASEIAPSITALFNLSIRCNRPPRQWKKSHVVPIPKQKSNAPTVADFRPISLLPVLSKLLEKHFHWLISDHISQFSPLSKTQWGFQPGKSTVQALLVTIDNWLQYLERGCDVGAVFFDFKKAFDSVPHIPLITKLQQLNLDPNIVSWVRNYLSDRSQCVVINGVCSEYLPVISGAPQGSVLGPLLFLIYINDLTDLDISMGSKIVLYADDILLYRPVSSDSDFVSLQRDINMIQTWASSNFMTFNESKCKVMHISRKRYPLSPCTSIMLNGSILETVTMYKYLGLLISSDLSWSNHIQSVCSKARKIVGLIYRKYYRFSDTATLLQLYRSLVRPHAPGLCCSCMGSSLTT